MVSIMNRAAKSAFFGSTSARRFHERIIHSFVHRQRPASTVFARHISERSFLEETLREQGVKLEPAPEEPLVVVEEGMVDRPTPRVQKLADEILDLNLLEVNMLFKLLQKILGISDEMLVGGGGGGDGGGSGTGGADAPEAAAEAVKDTFDLKLKGFDAKAKIKIIKEVRGITGLGLKEAKELVEKAPVVIKDTLTKEDAEKLQKVLVDAGADIELV
eukprot:CAMPEP_0185024772 /NCGR_PEP_ID=MMETSP1103-20130426/7985_1 /TAXON_ID=36769 /ORGANISM="Paraphysomonas bandaiensis, Strain Caron Lab Isolate" /LENGTH=216 /DNA_ID=CAMNT_0027557835 /DNA_START=71 /DNA_END=721 /DNA_ORIENTATION=+